MGDQNAEDNGLPPGPVALTLQQVRAKVGLSHTTIYGLMAEGKFPKAAKVGKRSLWLLEEVDAWLLARFADRPPTTESGDEKKAQAREYMRSYRERRRRSTEVHKRRDELHDLKQKVADAQALHDQLKKLRELEEAVRKLKFPFIEDRDSERSD